MERNRIEVPEEVQNIPYVLYEMAERRHEKRYRNHWILHLVQAAVLLAVVLALLLWPRKTVQPTGLYNLVDSHGVVIATDTPADKIEELLRNMQEMEDQ